MFNFLVDYWYVIALAVVVLAYFLIKNQAKGKAKAEVLKYFAVAEKMVFDNMDEKLKFVASASYVALPKYVRSLISPALFTLIVTQSYDSIKALVEYKK